MAHHNVSDEMLRSQFQGTSDTTASAAAAAANAAMKNKGQGPSPSEPRYIQVNVPPQMGAQDVERPAPMPIPVAEVPIPVPKSSGGGKQKNQGNATAAAAQAPDMSWDQSGGGCMGGFHPGMMGMGTMGYPPAPATYAMHQMPGFGGMPYVPGQIGMPGQMGMPWAPMPWGMPGHVGMPGYMAPGVGMPPPVPQQGPSPGGRNQGGPRKTPGAAPKAGASEITKNRERRRRGKTNGKAGERPPSPGADDADANINRSPMLIECRKQTAKCKLSLYEVQPHIVEFATDQHGARFLQMKLDELGTHAMQSKDGANMGGNEEKQIVVDAFLHGQPQPEAIRLASDAVGNFVIQKLFDVGTVEQKRDLAKVLQPELLKLACETHGCRVVQKAIQHVPRESQLLLAEKLKENVIGCIENMHGNHVIQKCIEQMPPDSVTFIINAVQEETLKMAMNIYGCRVVQRLLEHCAPAQLEGMLEKILNGVPKLAQDQYGNYVVQHMLEHGRREDKKRIIKVVETNIVEFAKHKCSSNVVEKCLEIATVGEHAQFLDQERTELFAAVLGQPGDPSAPIQLMMEDRYGNYIVQRMIEHSRGKERDLLKQRIDEHAPQLKQSAVGKHIVEAAQKEFGQ